MIDPMSGISMVERVASALRVHHDATWEDLARAAIIAMREPTIAMEEAGRGFVGIRVTWERMIDAALEREKV